MIDLFTILSDHKRPLAFTGEGVSPSCDSNVLNTRFSITDIFNLDFFNKKPKKFYEIYKELLKWTKLEPTLTHQTLSQLQIPIITQNIDGLHNKAGSTNVIEIHGNLNNLECPDCTYSITSSRAFQNDKITNKLLKCPICDIYLKPSFVFFGEPIKDFDHALNALNNSDLLIVIGNALKVWPANQLVHKAQKSGCEILLINDDPNEIFRSISRQFH